MEKKTIINEAAIAAVIFGVVAGAFSFANYAITDVKGATILSSVFWIVKTGGLIWLMIYMMKRLCAKYPEADNGDTRLYGTFIALFSAIITALLTFVAAEYAFPDKTAGIVDQAYQMYGQFADSNTMETLSKVLDNYNVINLFSTIIWCFIYGSILSVIVSSRIPSPDPFRNFKKEEESTTDEQ